MPLLSYKTIFKSLKVRTEVANIFTNYFSKIVSLLQIPESNNIEPQSDSMFCPKLKSIMKYRRHPSITAIQDAYKGSSFSFSTVERSMLLWKSKTSTKRKLIQDDDILALSYLNKMSTFSRNTFAFFTIMQ